MNHFLKEVTGGDLYEEEVVREAEGNLIKILAFFDFLTNFPRYLD